MLTAVFGFSVTRLPFVAAVALGLAYCIAFTANGAREEGSARSSPLQVLLVVGFTVVSASVGAYLLERSQREVYVQGRTVQSAATSGSTGLLRQYLSPDVAHDT